jgi:hypothetical protein
MLGGINTEGVGNACGIKEYINVKRCINQKSLLITGAYTVISTEEQRQCHAINADILLIARWRVDVRRR